MNLIQYFSQKGQKIFEHGIFNLPKIWEKVVEQNSQYIIDWKYRLKYEFIISFHAQKV